MYILVFPSLLNWPITHLCPARMLLQCMCGITIKPVMLCIPTFLRSAYGPRKCVSLGANDADENGFLPVCSFSHSHLHLVIPYNNHFVCLYVRNEGLEYVCTCTSGFVANNRYTCTYVYIGRTAGPSVCAQLLFTYSSFSLLPFHSRWIAVRRIS